MKFRLLIWHQYYRKSINLKKGKQVGRLTVRNSNGVENMVAQPRVNKSRNPALSGICIKAKWQFNGWTQEQMFCSSCSVVTTHSFRILSNWFHNQFLTQKHDFFSYFSSFYTLSLEDVFDFFCYVFITDKGLQKKLPLPQFFCRMLW